MQVCLPGLTQGVKSPALLQAAAKVTAAAQIQPLARELPNATGGVIKKKELGWTQTTSLS